MLGFAKIDWTFVNRLKIMAAAEEPLTVFDTRIFAVRHFTV